MDHAILLKSNSDTSAFENLVSERMSGASFPFCLWCVTLEAVAFRDAQPL